MKRFFALLAIAGIAATVLFACGGSKKEENKEEESAYDDYAIAEPEGPSAEDVIAEGKTLVEGSDCKTCHHATNKIIGPSHTEVAEKYEFTEANVKMLAGKIVNGGSGVWGQIAMTPHPNVSQIEAEKMSRYILSLDGEQEK